MFVNVGGGRDGGARLREMANDIGEEGGVIGHVGGGDGLWEGSSVFKDDGKVEFEDRGIRKFGDEAAMLVDLIRGDGDVFDREVFD